MDAELLSLFNKQGTAKESVDFLCNTIGVKSLDIWACLCNEVSDVDAIAAKGPKKDDPIETARLKAVWKKASVIAARRDKRAAAGLPSEDLEEPLP